MNELGARRGFLVLLILWMPGGGVFAQDADLSPNRPEAAVRAEVYTRRVEKNPEDAKAWAGLVQARIDADDLERAEKALKAWRAKAAKPAPGMEQMQAKLAFAREDYPGSIEAWERYLALAPKDGASWEALAKVYEAQQDWKNAAGAISKTVELAPSAKAFAERAADRVRAHDWSGSEADVRAGNRLDATDPEIHLLFPAFERMAKWLPVMSTLDASIAKEPGNAHLRLNRAEWLIAEGLTDAAWDDIEAAWKADPKSLRSRMWHGIMAWEQNVGDREGKAGDVMPFKLQNATVDFETELKAMDASPDPEARARFLRRYHQPVLALDEVKEVDGSPLKALALLDLGRLPEAGWAARRAVEVHPREAEAWLALAQLELGNGNFKESAEAAERSLKLKKTPEAEELRKNALRGMGKK